MVPLSTADPVALEAARERLDDGLASQIKEGGPTDVAIAVSVARDVVSIMRASLSPDPVFAAIKACREGWEQILPADLRAAEAQPTEQERERAVQEATLRQAARWVAAREARPTTLAGAAAHARFVAEMEREMGSDRDPAESLEAVARGLEALASQAATA